MKNIIENIRQELRQNSDEKTRKVSFRFFKEAIKPYGVKSTIVEAIAKKYFKEIRDNGKEEIFALCEELWKSEYMEEPFIACDWSYYIRKKYEPADFKVFQKWVDTYVTNWASCDTFCNHSIGAFLEMYPEFLPELKRWAKSKNRWMRRASAVSLIIPAREGKFLYEIYGLADILLLDQDDLVQKGYGWMLKEASRKHQKEVFEYVMKNKTVMPRTALRYAIEKMPKELKIKAMDRAR